MPSRTKNKDTPLHRHILSIKVGTVNLPSTCTASHRVAHPNIRVAILKTFRFDQIVSLIPERLQISRTCDTDSILVVASLFFVVGRHMRFISINVTVFAGNIKLSTAHARRKQGRRYW